MKKIIVFMFVVFAASSAMAKRPLIWGDNMIRSNPDCSARDSNSYECDEEYNPDVTRAKRIHFISVAGVMESGEGECWVTAQIWRDNGAGGFEARSVLHVFAQLGSAGVTSIALPQPIHISASDTVGVDAVISGESADSECRAEAHFGLELLPPEDGD